MFIVIIINIIALALYYFFTENLNGFLSLVEIADK